MSLEEARRKLIERNKRGLSEESKNKIRLSLTGRTLSEEAKRKISLAMKNRKPLSKESCKKIADKLRGRKFSEERKSNISKSLVGRKLSLEHCIKISSSNKGKHCHSEEFKQRQRERMIKNNPVKLNPFLGFQKGKNNIMFGKILPHLVGENNPMKNPEMVKKMVENRRSYEGGNNPNFGVILSEETKDKIRLGIMLAIKSGKYNIKPTKPEIILNKCLQYLFPGEYKYTGDFQVWIGGKNPDFMNVNGQKKLIEMFGDYWHEGEDETKRINHFKEFGFNTLIIWESELRNLVLVNNKLKQFHSN